MLRPELANIYLVSLTSVDLGFLAINLCNICFRPGQICVLHPDLDTSNHITCYRLLKPEKMLPTSETNSYV